MTTVIIVIVTLVILIIIWVVCGQNKLVHAEELCGNALSQIGVQQASRWDTLNALADLTKGYSEQEHRVLMETIAARRSVGSKTPVAEAQRQEDMLTQSFGRIHALAEAYPDLKSNTVYLKTMDSVQSFEEKVRMSRMVYNDTVTKYNRLVRALPGSLVAKSLRFGVREYLQDDPGKTDMPNMAR